MIVQVKLFAAARQAVGQETAEVPLADAASVGDLRRQLVDQWPALAPLGPYLLFAVDQQFADDDLPLAGKAEIACFPPVSGG